MSGFEGIGEAVTGGMMARAVEPSAGEAGHGEGQACLNCGAILQGEYCHHCGQPAHIHRSLHAFFHDLLHGVLHFEGKTWRTLPMLAFRPGELTRRYIAGERARFVSPMAIFLFSVFLMFAVFSTVGGPFSGSHEPSVVQQEATRDLQSDMEDARDKLKDAEQELAEAKAEGESTVSEARAVADAKANLAALQTAVQVASAATKTIAAETKAQNATAKASNEAAKQANEAKQGDESIVREVGSGEVDLEDGIKALNVSTGFSPLDDAIAKLKGNPKLALYKLQSNAYKFSWALIPISVPLVWLLFFWKRKFKLYDHTVFVTYSIAAMSMGVIILSLLRPLGLGENAVEAAITFLPPIHMYKQLKGAYGLSRFSAFWRTIMLIVFAFVAAGWFFAMLFAIGVVG